MYLFVQDCKRNQKILVQDDTTEEIKRWIEQRNRDVGVDVHFIPFSEMEGWKVDEEGCLRHNSGKFFSIEGIHIETDYGKTPSWDQPIINQPEVGDIWAF